LGWNRLGFRPSRGQCRQCGSGIACATVEPTSRVTPSSFSCPPSSSSSSSPSFYPSFPPAISALSPFSVPILSAPHFEPTQAQLRPITVMEFSLWQDALRSLHERVATLERFVMAQFGNRAGLPHGFGYGDDEASDFFRVFERKARR
jgi:hypothetical protein